MEILLKHQPTSLKDVIGNRIQINKIIQILSCPKYEQKILGIIGPNGSVKSNICNLIFKKMYLNVLDLHEFNLKTMLNFCNHKIIESFFKLKQKIFLSTILILVLVKKSLSSLQF